MSNNKTEQQAPSQRRGQGKPEQEAGKQVNKRKTRQSLNGTDKKDKHTSDDAGEGRQEAGTLAAGSPGNQSPRDDDTRTATTEGKDATREQDEAAPDDQPEATNPQGDQLAQAFPGADSSPAASPCDGLKRKRTTSEPIPPPAEDTAFAIDDEDRAAIEENKIHPSMMLLQPKVKQGQVTSAPFMPGQTSDLRRGADLVDFTPATYVPFTRASQKMGPYIPQPHPNITPITKDTVLPAVHGDHRGYHFRNIHQDQLAALRGYEGPVVMAVVWQKHARSNDAEEIPEKIKQALTLATGETEFEVVPPVEQDSSITSMPAMTWWITGTSLRIANRFEAQRVVSCRDPEITIFLLPYGIASPRFVCGFQGFTSTNKDAIRKAIRCRLDQQDTHNVILALSATNPDLKDLSAEVVKERILGSLEVTILDIKKEGGLSAPVANIYIDSPTMDGKSWFFWRDHIFRLTYPTNDIGTGRGYISHVCTGCHGVDHPRGLCPFGTIPFWNGAPEDQDTKDDARKFAVARKGLDVVKPKAGKGGYRGRNRRQDRQ